MRTSSFRLDQGPGAISIARWVPRGYGGHRVYRPLAPGDWCKLPSGKWVDDDTFEVGYAEQLGALDPQQNWGRAARHRRTRRAGADELRGAAVPSAQLVPPAAGCLLVLSDPRPPGRGARHLTSPRPGGQARPVTSRGNAEDARSVAFNRLIETPGRQTFEAILRLADHPDHPIPMARLRRLAEERAAKDSESAPWPPAEVVDFERVAQRAPTSAPDLQRLALRHLADIQHDLLHDDFVQGAALQMLPKEALVQTWTANQLRSEHQHLYSVERESQVVEEKEPDIRLRAKAADARMPIEIKVADDWRLVELETALTEQLCAKYLRARRARRGILLLVYQGHRKRWSIPKPARTWLFRQSLIG